MADGADDPTIPTDDPQRWADIGKAFAAGIATQVTGDDVVDHVGRGLEASLQAIVKGLGKSIVPIASFIGKALVDAEQPILPIFAAFMTPIVGSMFGSDVDGAMFNSRDNGAMRETAAAALVDALMSKLAGDADGEIEPGDEGAKRVATTAVHASIEGWFNAWILEMLGECVPWDWLHFSEMTALPHDVARSLGLGRLVQRAIRPLITATASTPMQSAANKRYRPKLLAEATALRAFVRGRWDWADVSEELARIGYSDTRIEELYNEQRKFLTPDDLADLLWLELLSQDDALQTMLDEGYDEQNASKHLNIRKIRREDTIRREGAAAALAAYEAGRIDGATLHDVLGETITAQHERDLVELSAGIKRAMAAKPLTAAETEAAVVAGVLAFPDYREALARENRTDDAIDVLDLLLRIKVQAGVDAKSHKAQQDAEKKAAAQQKADAAAAKKAEIDAARQLKAQGPIAELEHAVVVGLIPIDRLVSVLAQQFTSDTVAIYVADVTQKRADYVAQQQQKADAATRADNKGLNVGQLEQAVYDGIIPLATLTTLLQQRGLSAGDVQILTATVQARKADLDAAKQKRADADRRASNKKISLARAETLVQLGHWTMAQYDALLVSLEFDDAARAGLEDLLQTSINARASGSSLRQQLAGASPSKALTLEQFRKAVIAGDKTIDDFSAFLTKAGYTSDARAVLLDELAADVAGAQAAQLRRQQGDTTGGAVAINLATASKAARLGIISPAAYQQRLVAAGYSDDDVALEMDLLTAEIAKGKPAQQAAAGVAASPASKGLTLTALANAVKHGTASLEDYRGAAAASGLSADAVDTLVADLTDALAVKSDAKAAHDNIAATLATQGVTLTALEDQVRAGTLTVVALEQQLVGYGYSDVEAQLVGSLLEQELAAPEVTP